MFNKIKLLLIIITILPTLILAEQSTASIKENIDYKTIQPIPSSTDHSFHDPKKIYVTEFMSYHCGHCYLMTKQLRLWASSHPEIVLQTQQVVYQNYFTEFAKINATITALNHPEWNEIIFKAVQQDNQNLEDINTLKNILKKNLTNKEYNKFMSVYESFAISNIPNQYKQDTTTHNITATPTIYIQTKNNNYEIMPNSPERVITVAEQLIKK